MRDALRKLKPDSFDDIIAMNALYRPGPMDNIPRYINCKHGIEQPEYLHPLLEPILKETYGVIIYQEQVMQIARELAGYSLGGADLLRRAMGKKIKAEMDAQREVFIEGAIARRIPQKLATAIFEQVAKFASYGFPKAHATAYALLAYQTAYLKANHPLEFFAAAMTMDRANQDKLNALPPGDRAGRDRAAAARRQPWRCQLHRRGRRRSAMRWRRSAGSACRRSRRWSRSARRAARSPTCSTSPPAPARGILNRRLLEALIKAGALDRLHGNRRQALEAIDLALRYGAAHVEQATSDQASLFGSLMEQPELPKPRLPEVADLPELERLQQEFEALGCYLTAHPLEGYRASLARLGVTPSDQLALCGGLRVKLAGVVLGKQERSTARSRFAFVQLSDPSGVYEVTLFAELLGRVRELLEANQPLLVEGDVRLDGDLVKVQASVGRGARRRARQWRPRGLDSQIEIRLADAAAADGLADLLGPHGDGSARVRVVLPLDPAEEVAIELGDDHRLALVRRIDLERRAGVVSVVDL